MKICATVVWLPLCFASPVIAQSYPSKPVRIVVGFSAGSATDITARMIAPKLSEVWKQAVVVENRPGGGSALASAMVAKATPDGHTLLCVSNAFLISAILQKNASYDPLKDFSGVTQIGASTGVIVVGPSVGVKTLKELIALANERPGKILFGSAGAGSGLHLTTELFRFTAGIKAVHVGFKGQPEMIIEILAGRVHFGIPGLGPSIHLIKDGRLVPLAVVTHQRSPMLPDIPTVNEILPTFQREAAHVLVAPVGTPRPILHKISRDVARILDLSDVKQQMHAISFVPAPTTPEELDKLLRANYVTLDRVARLAGLKAP